MISYVYHFILWIGLWLILNVSLKCRIPRVSLNIYDWDKQKYIWKSFIFLTSVLKLSCSYESNMTFKYYMKQEGRFNSKRILYYSWANFDNWKNYWIFKFHIHMYYVRMYEKQGRLHGFQLGGWNYPIFKT